jgi:hypothetical protein
MSMPSTPKIVTRSETTSSNTTENLNKGSKLTFAEMDSNFIELKNGSIGIVGDDSTGIDIAQGSTLKVAGTGGIATSVSGDTLTVDASSIVTTSLGDLTAVGSTLIAPSNADLTLSASGTGAIVTADTVELTQNTNLTPNLVVSGYSSTFLKLGNHPTESNQGNSIFGEGGPLYLAATGSNNVISENDITIETGNISAPNDVNMTLSVSGTGQISVDGATIGSNSIELDQLTISGNSIRTNVTNANLEFDTNGTGNIFLGDIEVAAHLANRDTFTALNIPFSSDGSTSQDVSINLDSQGDPNITFNHASTANGAGAKIKTNTGNLILQSGSQRIELAANTVQIGNNTIVVSGNRMSTDASNEDLEFDANGTGNVSSLAQLNMNSNKIINVTDPASAQDAATKAYVDAQVLASGDTGDLTINGSTITAPSNADLTLTVAGTGSIVVDGTLTATEVISDLTGTIEFDAKATEAITKGEAVYIAGIDGNTPTVALARANAAGTMPAFGIAAADIALNATGKITTFGSLTGLDAADFGETSITFALGDTIYISSAEAGKLTNVAPAGEANFIQNIGKIERATPTTNITIKVGGAGRSNATPALNDGNIFIGNASNQATTTSLQTQVESYSINNVVEDTTPQLGGNLDINGNSIVSVSGGNISITPDTTGNIILDGLTFPNADGTANQILGTNGSGVLSFRDPTAINIDGGVADSTYTSVPTIDGGTA